jgi:recombinational DNA repair ATPase RecF
MYLQSITLRQFRNHRHLELAVEPGVNLFLGSNGAGKTNILEAIAVLATGVSPRNAESESLVQWGEVGFAVKGEFAFEESGLDPMTLEMKYRVGAPRTIRLYTQPGRQLATMTLSGVQASIRQAYLSPDGKHLLLHAVNARSGQGAYFLYQMPKVVSRAVERAAK